MSDIDTTLTDAIGAALYIADKGDPSATRCAAARVLHHPAWPQEGPCHEAVKYAASAVNPQDAKKAILDVLQVYSSHAQTAVHHAVHTRRVAEEKAKDADSADAPSVEVQDAD